MRKARYFDGAALRAGAALVLVLAVGHGLTACARGVERESERSESRVKEDVRGVRDFFYDRGITIDTRTAP